MATTSKASPAPKKKTTKTAIESTTKVKAATIAPGGTPAKKSPAKTPVAKTTAKLPVAKATAPKKPKAAARTAKADIQQRRHYIEVAAYYIAERRGFMGGSEAEDWVTAEAEIDRLLAAGKLNAT